MLPISLSALTEFKDFNLVFDGIVAVFTFIYLIKGFSRGYKKSIWFLIFNVVSIVAAYSVAKIGYPMFRDSIPLILVNYLPNTGLAFMLSALYKVIIELILAILTFYILRCKIFSKIAEWFADLNFNYRKKKNFLGRIFSGLVTAGLAFTLSGGAISTINSVCSYTLFADYKTEMSETMIAKEAEKTALDIYAVMLDTDSVVDQNDLFLKTVTDGKYSASDMPSYRESFYRLMIAKNVDVYLAAIEFGFDNDAAISRFSMDLTVWASLAERADTVEFGTKDLLNKFVKPIAKKMAEKEFTYNKEETYIFSYDQHLSTYSSEVVGYFENIF